MDDELQPEYDFKELLRDGAQGKYVTRYQAFASLVLLDPDVAMPSPDEPFGYHALQPHTEPYQERCNPWQPKLSI